MNKAEDRKMFGSALVVLLLLAACSDDDTKKPRCDSATLEADLEVTPFTGPGADAESGELLLTSGKQYMVSSTYGVPVPGPDGAPVTAEYDEIFGGVAQQLMQQPGLLAFKLASSEACASGRTLAVWESEEAMYDFVTSPAHARAMQRVGAILKPGYGVTHWSASDRAQMTLEKGAQMLKEE